MNDNPVLSKLTFNKRTKRYDYKGNLTREEIESLLEINKCGFIVKLGKIDGDFNCSNLSIFTLRNAPTVVTGNFECDRNELLSLEGAPTKVGGDFNCSHNKLHSLRWSPKEVGGNFYCYDCTLESLEGVPKKVDGNFDCSYNKLISLEGAPKYIGGNFYYEQTPNLDPINLNIMIKGEFIG